MISTRFNYNGFTIVELMVVITIVSILSLIVITSIFEGRKSARDTVRINEVTELKLGTRLYKESYGSYPDYEEGVQLGADSDLDNLLQPFVSNLTGDPLSTESGSDYEYWYVSNFTCSQANQSVVFVKNVELSQNANFEEVCTAENPDTDIAGPNSHIVILHSGPYAQAVYYSQSSYVIYAQCTLASNGSWGGDWPSPPVEHGTTWQTSGGFGIFAWMYSHRCCDGTVRLLSGATYPSCSGPYSYSQSSYYAQSSYYSQSSYYAQSSYYSQSNYSFEDESSDGGGSGGW